MTTVSKKKNTKKNKRTAARAGGNNLSRMNFIQSWMIIPMVVIVVAVGYFVINYSQAAACSYKYCWGAYQFKGATSKSVLNNNGRIYWSSYRDKDGKVNVTSSVAKNSYYCIDATYPKPSPAADYPTVVITAYSKRGAKIAESNRISPNRLDPKGGRFSGCLFVPATKESGRKIEINTVPDRAGGNGPVFLNTIYRTS